MEIAIKNNRGLEFSSIVLPTRESKESPPRTMRLNGILSHRLHANWWQIDIVTIRGVQTTSIIDPSFCRPLLRTRIICLFRGSVSKLKTHYGSRRGWEIKGSNLIESIVSFISEDYVGSWCGRKISRYANIEVGDSFSLLYSCVREIVESSYET